MSSVQAPALLKRFVDDPAAMPLGAAAHFDRERNILFINRPIYDSLNSKGKTSLWRCTGTIILEAK